MHFQTRIMHCVVSLSVCVQTPLPSILHRVCLEVIVIVPYWILQLCLSLASIVGGEKHYSILNKMRNAYKEFICSQHAKHV